MGAPLIENVEKIEKESADRRRADIIYRGLWKWILGFAAVFSIGGFYLAFQRLYLSHQDREIVNALSVCVAFLMPWVVTGSIYRQLRARLLASNAQDLVPFVRFSGALALMITFGAIQIIVSLCLTTR
jgi:hypothetical protein